WGTSYAPMITPEWAGRPAEMIHAPHVSIYGVSTPEEFYESLQGGDIANGTLNRFMLLSEAARPYEQDPKVDAAVVPSQIVEGMRSLFGGGNAMLAASKCCASTVEITPIKMEWQSAEANLIRRELIAEVEHIMDTNPHAAPFYARTAEMAVRLATIRAAGQSPKPSISAEDMNWARQVALWSAQAMMRGAGLYMAETEHQADANRILRIIQEHGGRITHRDLHRRLKHRMRSKDVLELMKALAEAASVTIEKAIPEGGGPPSTWYALTGSGVD
ncbi:MAG: hypothetical protein ACREDP_12810, partial [Bradyrhizobium sp.]